MMGEQKIIQIIGLVTGGRTPFDSQFVVEYDASRPDSSGSPNSCHLVTTPNLDEATRYSEQDAFKLWRAVDRRNPVRGDGKPNRPLRMFKILFLAAPAVARVPE
jgi:hypothetical protein